MIPIIAFTCDVIFWLWDSTSRKLLLPSFPDNGSHTVFIHFAVCLTTGPNPLTKRALHIVRSRASSSKWEYPLLSLRSSSNFLRLIPHLPVTSIPPFIFPSITCCRRQFLHKMWPIQLVFHLLISCRIFLIHSFSILSDDRSKVSSKTIPPHSAI